MSNAIMELATCPYRPSLSLYRGINNNISVGEGDGRKKEERETAILGVDGMDGVDGLHTCLPPPSLYVSSSLNAFLEPWDAGLTSEDHPTGRYATGPVVIQDGMEYRRLDAAWYHWLYKRMARAQAANLPPDTWNALRTRFAVVHAWAFNQGIIA